MEGKSMHEQEDCNLYAGNLDQETTLLMEENNEDIIYTINTAFLTIFCC